MSNIYLSNFTVRVIIGQLKCFLYPVEKNENSNKHFYISESSFINE